MNLTKGTVIVMNGEAYTLGADVEAEPVNPPVRYPKLLWSATGEEITVQDAGDEAAHVAQGYRETREEAVEAARVAAEAPAAPEEDEPDPFDTEPTFGDAGDDSHTRRARKKK